MGQVNVTSGHEPGEPSGSAGAGMILGIIIAILVIAALVYFLILAPDRNGARDTPGDVDTNGDNGDMDNGEEPEPTGWRLVQLG